MTAYSPTPGYDEWRLSQCVEAVRLHAEHRPAEVDWDAVAEVVGKLDGLLRQHGVRRAA